MGSNLDVVLTKKNKSIVFQVKKQNEVINSFLDLLKRTKKGYFMANNGIRVGSDEFPEIKESKNTIFLRGNISSLDNKRDVTNYYSNNQRDGSYDMYKDALSEFASAADKAYYGGLTTVDASYITFGRTTNPFANVNKLNRSNFSTITSWTCRPIVTERILSF